MSKNEKELIKLGLLHNQLVESLKGALLGVQVGFFLAASILYDIKTKKTYRGEDLSYEWTWKEFCERPDLPIPGRSPESRRRCADALVRIHKFYMIDKKYNQKLLAPIGWTKLEMIIPFCEKATDISTIEDWIERARSLSINNLKAEMINEGGETFANVNCQHENEALLWYCPKCGLKSEQPMNIKHRGITIKF